MLGLKLGLLGIRQMPGHDVRSYDVSKSKGSGRILGWRRSVSRVIYLK